MTSHVPRVAAAASRRAVLRGLTSAASALALCGCAGMAAGPRFDASALVLNPTLLVASTRKPVNGARAKPWFGTERGKMTVARATLTHSKVAIAQLQSIILSTEGSLKSSLVSSALSFSS